MSPGCVVGKRLHRIIDRRRLAHSILLGQPKVRGIGRCDGVQGLLQGHGRGARCHRGSKSSRPTASSLANTTRTSARRRTPKPASRTSARRTKCSEVPRSVPRTINWDRVVPPVKIFARLLIGAPALSSAVRAGAIRTTAISSSRCSARGDGREPAMVAAHSIPDAAKTITRRCCSISMPHCAAALGSSPYVSLKSMPRAG